MMRAVVMKLYHLNSPTRFSVRPNMHAYIVNKMPTRLAAVLPIIGSPNWRLLRPPAEKKYPKCIIIAQQPQQPGTDGMISYFICP